MADETNTTPPVTPERFAARQRRDDWHPLTCGQRDGHPHEEEYGDHGVLRLREDGRTMFCAHCDYTQPLPEWDIVHAIGRDPEPTPSAQG